MINRSLISVFFLIISISLSALADSPRIKKSLLDSFLPRKSVDRSILGVNAFVNDPQFGSVSSQLSEVKNTLGIKYVRVLFAWLDEVQPTPTSTPNFSFYDDIVNSLPDGVEAVAVLAGLPTWMKDSSNWIDGDPRKTFVEKWVKVVSSRYSNKRKLKAIQVWNEPNTTSNPDNKTLGVTSPQNYYSMLKLARTAIKKSSKKLVINAATTAINQNYPKSLRYNRTLKDLGAESLVDVWAAHFYGKSVENVIRPGGIKSFFRTFTKPIWFTESGEKGTNKQREYVERYWTFLKSQISGIKRIYFYQFTENTPASSTYGMKNPTAGSTVSDFYIYLRDNPA